MSYELVARAGGPVWRVRWRDEQGQGRSHVVGTKRDAIAFDADIRRKKRLGELNTLDRGTETLAEFVGEWWRRYATPNLAARTRASYATTWDRHVLPYLGGLRLRELTVDVLEDWVGVLRDAGVGEPTVYRALAIVQGVLQRACEWGRLSSNPARLVRKPAVQRARSVRPLADSMVESLVDAVDRERDKLIISLMAYAGLRPAEVTALEWRDVSGRVLVIDKSLDADGTEKPTKTGTNRAVEIIEPLKSRLETAEVRDGRIVGKTFREHDWRNWLRDVWRPACQRAGVIGVRPYDLRHTYISKMIHDGRSVVQVAAQAGNSPAVTLGTYSHLFEEAA